MQGLIKIGTNLSPPPTQSLYITESESRVLCSLKSLQYQIYTASDHYNKYIIDISIILDISVVNLKEVEFA